MKKILIIATIILLIIVIIFIILLNRKQAASVSKSIEINLPSTLNFFNGSKPSKSSATSPIQKNTFGYVQDNEKLKDIILPYYSEDFNLTYSYQLHKYLLVKKTNNADTAFANWISTNGYGSILNDKNNVLVKDLYNASSSSSGGNSNASGGGFGENASNSIPYENGAISLLSNEDQKNLDTAKSHLISNQNVTVQYNAGVDTFFVDKKTAQADTDLKKWADAQHISNIINNPDIFLPTPQQAINKYVEDIYSENPFQSVIPTPTPFFKETYDNLQQLLQMSGGIQQTNPAATPEVNPPSSLPGSNFPPSDENLDVLALIRSYGLPTPVADGARGYTALLNSLNANSNAQWSTKQLLNAERLYESKNPTAHGLPKINRYLTTAWMWWENAAWPDPYEVNCNDNEAISTVSTLCQTNNFQVAGYQAAARKNDYLRIFRFLYSDGDLTNVLNRVVTNSDKAVRWTWRYNDSRMQKDLVNTYLPQIDSATINDISPSNNFFDPKTQFMTLIVGKDPAMAIGLNTFAVSESDLIGQLHRTDNCPYNSKYYCGSQQVFSNMIAALYMFDTNSSSLSGPVAGGSGTGSGSAPVSTDGLVYYNQCDPQFNPPSVGTCPGRKGPVPMICYAGCGLTSSAMILSSYTGKKFTPLDVKNIYSYFSCDGTTIEDAKNAMQRNGLQTSGFIFYNDPGYQIGQVAGQLKNYLNSGWTIFTLIDTPVGGHFVWIISIDDNNNVITYDPYYGQNFNQSKYPSGYPHYRKAFAVKKP